MATHNQIEQWWAGRRCEGPHVSLDLNGRYPVRVQPELEAAGVMLGDVMVANGYRTPMGPTGSYNCRTIGGSNTWSLHAYAVAVDWDYGRNPYLRGQSGIVPGFGTDPRFEITEAQVDAVAAIVNVNGDSIWRWLGWSKAAGGISDTMHFQVDQPPNLCEPAGGPIPPPNERPTVYLPLRESDGYDSNPARREDVKWLQRALNRTERAPGLTVDGKYGPGTSLAVHDLMTGGDGTVYGWDEHDALLLAAYGGDDGPGGPHTHPIGPSVPS